MDRVKKYQACAWILYLGDWVENELDKLMAAEKLTLTQARVLRLLAVRPGISPGEVARLLNRDESTTTGILNRLEKRSLIKRAWSETDRRQANIWLTDAGREMFRFFHKEMLKLPVFEAMKAIDDAELTNVINFFEKVASNSDLIGFTDLIQRVSETLAKDLHAEMEVGTV